ncbi:hypothetical protein B0T10DRAFT_566978 [Thelonectria olida]|uniref:Peptidase S8/S53 domain-containing protein n=1 Tax=Thelonectria olida TaxID=1576542 RepID=A0A9P9AK35_9HYPO|nr:hypothetical protein B0T10DRAFT_566978 [Thelonectria olida]
MSFFYNFPHKTGGTNGGKKIETDFNSMIPTVPEDAHTGPDLRRVRVALIDDGVEMFNKGMHRLQSRFQGRSFDTMPDGPSPIYSSVSRHGTFMSKSILRVCPFAAIVPYQLKVTPDSTSKLLRPEPRSAAQAIRAAIHDGVDIISMSWTIRKDGSKSDHFGMDELRNVVHKARTAGQKSG